MFVKFDSIHMRASITTGHKCAIASLACALLLPGCGSSEAAGDFAWAINVGGEAYETMDGTRFEQESSVTGGTVGSIETIKGSQDSFLYESYREGDIEVNHPIPNGTYDITFHFAEPDEIGQGERVFDVYAEGGRVIGDLDVVLFRDKKTVSALTVTVPDVVVDDGELNIHFAASVNEPIVSALLVRTRRPVSKSWELVWSDEFDGDELDTSSWSHNVWKPRKVNDEDQAYTARPENVRVEDGMLVIEAHKEDYDGASYTSGRIHTSGKRDFLYGRFEARAKLPGGQGTWPAIWMLPSDPFTYATTCEGIEDWQGHDDCDAWPNSGEIDIMEHVGYQEDHIHGTVHTRAYYWKMWEQRKGRILIDGATENFHVYALEWTPERIDIFVDDAHYFTYVNEGKTWREWPFDEPFHWILNIAVGGVWGRSGGPIDDSIFPQRMYIDWVRVYEDTSAN